MPSPRGHLGARPAPRRVAGLLARAVALACAAAVALPAPPAAAAPAQEISLALGLPSAELGWLARASERLSYGARISWDQLSREESLSVGAVGIAAPARLELASGRLTFSLEAAPGARHFAGHLRGADCGCILDTRTAWAIQLPLTASLRAALSEGAGVAVFSTLAPDLLLSGGLLLSPQAGLAVDAAPTEAFSLGLLARAGRVLVLGDAAQAVLGGRRAVTLPLALLLTATLRL